MKRLLLLLSTSLICASPGFAREDSLLARITVYWAHGGRGADHDTRQHKSATGQRLRQGHCAVDPRKIPYGSRVVLPDGTALSAVDTGSAVRSRRAARGSGRTAHERNAIVIDKFFENKRQALAWASSNPPFVNVKVIPPNAPAMAKPNIANSQPIALNPVASTNSQLASSKSSPATTALAVVTPTGGVVRNPLGRLGR